MIENTLHILNGQWMYEHFKQSKFLEGEMMIPFNEAMCYGDVSDGIFSDEFAKKRAEVHHVTLQQYTEITLNPLEPLLNKQFTSLELWFDSDMFCEINILTILAWLDQNNYEEAITLHIVDDNFTPTERYTLSAKGFAQLYNQVVINKSMPVEINLPLLKRGVELYLSYLDCEGELQQFIRNQSNKSEKELVKVLLETFREYGLGDTQYIELIRKVRK